MTHEAQNLIRVRAAAAAAREEAATAELLREDEKQMEIEAAAPASSAPDEKQMEIEAAAPASSAPPKSWAPPSGCRSKQCMVRARHAWCRVQAKAQNLELAPDDVAFCKRKVVHFRESLEHARAEGRGELGLGSLYSAHNSRTHARALAETTAGVLRAARYAGAECRAARAAEMARLPAWERVGGAHVASASISHELRAIYVPNTKAASSFLKGVMKLGFGAKTVWLRAAPATRTVVGWKQTVPPGYTAFTFVRSPLAATVSGFGETCRMEAAQRARSSTPRPPLGPSLAMPCADVASRFRAFVGELERGEPISRFAYHAWPQVAKLGSTAGDQHELDFIGEFDSLCDDLQVLLRRLGAPEDKVRTVGSVCSDSRYGGGASAVRARPGNASRSSSGWGARLASSLAFSTRSATARQQLGACGDHVHWSNGSLLQPDAATAATLRNVMRSDVICFA